MQWMKKIGDYYDHLTVREQRIIVATVLSVILFVFCIFAFFIYDSFDERKERIQNLRNAAQLLQKNRHVLQDNREVLAGLEMRASQKPPMLQGHLDTIAKQSEISPNFTPQKPKDLGDNMEYQVESVELRIHDAHVKNFMQFLDHVERGAYLVMVTELRLTTRRGQPDRMDPVLTVSSFYKRSAEELRILKDKEMESTDKPDRKETDSTNGDDM